MIKYFVNFVELKTKLISVFSFIVAVLFYFYYLYPTYGVDVINIIIFFVSMLAIDMFTTALNHLSAIFKEKKKSLYDEKLLQDMNNNNYSMKTNYAIIIGLFVVFTVLGVILVYRSNVGVLLLGMLSVFIGIIYSFGKKPIAYTPFGEIFAGGAMGVILPITIIFTQFDHLPFELNPLLAIVFMPLAFLIGNVLFANNICDLDLDVHNGRYTLAYYTGQKLGAKLLHLSNIGALGCVTVASLLGYVPLYFNVMYLLYIIMFKNTLKFSEKFDKEESFVFILKNFVVFMLTYCLFYIFSIII